MLGSKFMYILILKVQISAYINCWDLNSCIYYFGVQNFAKFEHGLQNIQDDFPFNYWVV